MRSAALAAFRRGRREARAAGPLSRPRHRLLRRGHRRRAVRGRDRAHRSLRADLRLIRRLPAGPGHGDLFAQVVADPGRSIPMTWSLSFTDTAAIPMGFGTIASRSTVNASAALSPRARAAEKVFAIAGICSNAPPAISSCATAAWASSACRARRFTLEGGAGGAAGLGHRPPAGVDAGLEETYLLRAADRDLELCGACRRLVEVDPEPGRVTIERYAVAHDCGVASTRCWSRARSWRRGAGDRRRAVRGARLRSQRAAADGSLMDYAMPIASEIPAFSSFTSTRRLRSTRSASRASAKAARSRRPLR